MTEFKTLIVGGFYIILFTWAIKEGQKLRRTKWLDNLTTDDSVKFKIDNITYFGRVMDVGEEESLIMTEDGDPTVIFTYRLRKIRGWDYNKHCFDGS